MSWELYAGYADITFLAHEYDLHALEPFDLLYDKDMNRRRDRQAWRHARREYKPLLVVVETECTDWNIFNENLNYRGRDRMDELHARRELQYPLVEEGIKACYDQIYDGNFFLFENPAASRIWELPRLQELATRDDVYVVQCHAGAYGGKNSKGQPIRKLYQWLTNSADIAEALSKKMSPDELTQCVPLIGKEVRRSARYPQRLCRAILRALKTEARRRWPQRFIRLNEVLYEEPMQDPAAWMDVINKTKRVFEMTSVRSLNLPDNDPLHKDISNLVPWELVRIQLARAPAQRRLPRDILFTHCGAAIEYQDGQIAIESESLDGMHFPKQKFSKGVSYAIFWFGYGEPLEAPAQQPSTSQPAEVQPGETPPPAPASSKPLEVVTFKNCPNDVPKEVCSAVKRLHLNLGHPSEKELLRLLAYQGAISKHMITAVKHLHCASCSRNKPPLKPRRPSAMPVANMGQFNDTIQTDVFYCRDVVGGNHAILGIIDQSTLLHQACRLKDMSSNHTLDIFRNLWFRPYGFPGTVRTDPGTNYGLHFKQYLERHGIWLEVIPAEAHWRIGLIERRNSVLRDILERIIDAESIYDLEDFDQALEAAIFALNSMTYSHGRLPYMAVFGQIPRIGAGLLQDDTSLVCHPEHQGAVRPEILRAEAMKALAEVNTSQTLRRALLRKTATGHQMTLEPGQNCAYWRWQVPKGRSTKKKGAWIVARFLSKIQMAKAPGYTVAQPQSMWHWNNFVEQLASNNGNPARRTFQSSSKQPTASGKTSGRNKQPQRPPWRRTHMSTTWTHLNKQGSMEEERRRAPRHYLSHHLQHL